MKVVKITGTMDGMTLYGLLTQMSSLSLMKTTIASMHIPR